MHNAATKLTAFNRSPRLDDANPFASIGFVSGPMAANGYGERHHRRAHLPPSLNSAAFTQAPPTTMAEVTPGTAYDMNFTPLLPSQLLLGSPFQPGSPANFASPQYASFGSIGTGPPPQPASHLHEPQHMGQAPVPPHIHPHLAAFRPTTSAPMSPSFFSGPASPSGAGHFFSTPQSPTMGPATSAYGPNSNLPYAPGMVQSTSRTVYLGNIPPNTSAEELLGHVRSGSIESVRLLPDKNCAFISFLESNSATHFHSDAILKKLSIHGQDIKIGWGKPSPVPTSVALAVQQSGASRNVYLGNLPEDITDVELRESLGKFGPIDTIKIVREKSIGFVHFLSIGHAIKAVAQLPQEAKWQPPRRVFYGKDRCAYVSKTQQQNAAQYLGIAPGVAHVLNGADRDIISNALAQQSLAAAAVATTAGGVGNLGNRTVYLGNIHPETTIEEICNVVRGGLLHHIRYIPDKHICFVTFIDPTSAASFYALSNLQGLMIHNRRLKIGWGKHSGALPPAIALAVSGGASRNVYIGNLDESWTEERLRQDFAEYGEIEQVNALREKSCAFVNFTNIANATKAIEGMRGREEYKRFKINFGKDRCGNAPRQTNAQQVQAQQQAQQPQISQRQQPQGQIPAAFATGRDINSRSPQNGRLTYENESPPRTETSQPAGSVGNGLPPNGLNNALHTGGTNPLAMYLNQLSQQPPDLDRALSDALAATTMASSQPYASLAGMPPAALYNSSSNELLNGSIVEPPSSGSVSSFGTNVGALNGSNASTIGGLLAPGNARSQHSRAISLPVLSQEPGANGNGAPNGIAAGRHNPSLLGNGLQPPAHHTHHAQQSSFSGLSSGFGGFGNASFGVAVGVGDGASRGLNGWSDDRAM